MSATSATPAVSAADVLALLARADLLLLLADALRPPMRQASSLVDVTRADVEQLLRTADLNCVDVNCVELDAPELSTAMSAMLDAFAAMDEQAWAGEYHRLFEGAMLCPLNETAYIRRDKGAVLGDLCGFYRAFGWQPDATCAEKPDHLVCELEFTAMLLVMAACAKQRGDAQACDVAIDALDKFAAAHLGDWLTSACAWLGQQASLPFYREVAAATVRLWSVLSHRHGWPLSEPAEAAPATPATPAGDDLQGPYECGAPGLQPTGTIDLTIGRSAQNPHL
jgi:TorA maturation chaperone TorD